MSMGGTTSSLELSGTIVPPTLEALELTFDNISNAPVADPTDFVQWNTFFDLPTYGTPFTSVTVNGNTVYLYGGSGITVKEALWCTLSYNPFPYLLQVRDNAECLIAADEAAFNLCTEMNLCQLREDFILNGTYVFSECYKLTQNDLLLTEIPIGTFSYGYTFESFTNAANVTTIGGYAFSVCNTALKNAIFPNATTIGENAFFSCFVIENIDIRSCTSLGSSVTDPNVFGNITGQTITLTVPAALMTCNGGGPHASIALLQLNNTVEIIEV